ncbi:hypothetical protein H6G45_01280 [Synechocystis sp. FACHB-383]|uniref:hypothetical protein n=1 Tax=Synechocystis sp. FACHB-383 TaxID=2692864 RepID=UPI00168213AA|nr:hypothetical protein [Synechocystis sp. FACHB-383]MBD2652143.1 hypothetical protein [Synechocystis sp. FACHB-383]
MIKIPIFSFLVKIKIDVTVDLEGECYGEPLDVRWDKDCNSYTLIEFGEENKQLNQKKSSYIVLVNGEMEKYESSYICGSSYGFSLNSVNEELGYESLISIEKKCLTE